MLTILHLTPELRAGGPRALAADLADELERSQGTHNIVMTPVGKDGTVRPVGTLAAYTTYPGGYLSPLLGISALGRFLAETKVDIIVTYTECAAWVAGQVCRRLPASHRPRMVGALTACPHRHMLGSGWKYCDAFTAVSRYLQGRWEAFSPLFRNTPLRVIPYGMREAWCNPAYQPSQAWQTAWNERFAPAPKELSLCLPAPVTPLHGHEQLVPLLATLRRNGIVSRVFLVGDSTQAPPRYPEHLKSIFRKSQTEANIVWLGARTELRDILCSCDITLSLDTKPATYNRPALEALCLGRPLVGYDHGVVGELLSAFLPEGRVAPGQVESVADTIIQWSFYRPSVVRRIPAPYRLVDTAESYRQLFEFLML